MFDITMQVSSRSCFKITTMTHLVARLQKALSYAPFLEAALESRVIRVYRVETGNCCFTNRSGKLCLVEMVASTGCKPTYYRFTTKSRYASLAQAVILIMNADEYQQNYPDTAPKAIHRATKYVKAFLRRL